MTEHAKTSTYVSAWHSFLYLLYILICLFSSPTNTSLLTFSARVTSYLKPLWQLRRHNWSRRTPRTGWWWGWRACTSAGWSIRCFALAWSSVTSEGRHLQDKRKRKQLTLIRQSLWFDLRTGVKVLNTLIFKKKEIWPNKEHLKAGWCFTWVWTSLKKVYSYE